MRSVSLCRHANAGWPIRCTGEAGASQHCYDCGAQRTYMLQPLMRRGPWMRRKRPPRIPSKSLSRQACRMGPSRGSCWRSHSCDFIHWAANLASSFYRKRRKVTNMPLLQVVVALIVVGILLWLVNRFIPMAGSIKSILNAVVVIAVVLWLLNIFGLMQSLSNIHIGKP